MTQLVQKSVWAPREATIDRRVHMSINVKNLAQSVAFYRVFFETNPVKVREGYAKFSLDDPAINFTVNEFPNSTEVPASGHFGIQVKDTDAVTRAFERLKTHDFKITDESGVACCYAVQSKIWVADPDGFRWEIFVTTEADADEGCGPTCICHEEFERSYAVS